jgi:hypothetical protein
MGLRNLILVLKCKSTHLSGTGECNFVHLGVVGEGGTGSWSKAGDDVKYSGRESSFLGKLGNVQTS